MATKNTETDELWGLERRYWDALKNRDAVTAAELSDDPCVIAGAQGVGSLTPRQLGAMMNDGRYELRNYREPHGRGPGRQEPERAKLRAELRHRRLRHHRSRVGALRRGVDWCRVPHLPAPRPLP